MLLKHPYLAPELQIAVFPAQDLIVTSFIIQDEGDGDSVDLGL